MERLNVFALILNYNSANETIELFKNLEEQNYKFLNILVIDNHSSNSDLIKLKENVPSKNLFLNKNNSGYAAGNNIGVDIALRQKADYIWILNPDIRITFYSLPILLNTIIEDKTLAAVGPRIIHRHNRAKIFSDGELLRMDEKCSTSQKNFNKDVSEIPGNVDYGIDYINGSSILLNCKAIREIGNFPEEYFLYFEETDWCFRARQNNWRLAINTNAIVYNLTSVKKSLFHYYFMRNKLIFCKKYHPDFSKVKNYYLKSLIRELLNRFKGKYFRPFYKSRIKGFISGILFTTFKI
ncbi:glycosyltransferase [Christiangramia crocea]|uniref:Glycosyltransferase family 2 protein n=1 Tax=Christiangramia crocea TaxID=2904124 RepID=A0A9X1V108_9FLAO|nr:glycosyltransferase family 2 protein [Gramella crocea]MCG9973024.1 glycosyltransferase family 2 protein [Gramella crocea]